MNRQEEILHQHIAEQWRNNHLPPHAHPDFQRLICNWNNAESSKGGNKMVTMGVKKGVADWQWLADNGKSTWIELKTDVGVQSKEQKQFQALCDMLGHKYVICRTADEVWNEIGWWPK